MNKIILVAAAAAAAVVLAPSVDAHPAFEQASFPCAEDEVLGYHPQFGPNRVGCIHVER